MVLGCCKLGFWDCLWFDFVYGAFVCFVLLLLLLIVVFMFVVSWMFTVFDSITVIVWFDCGLVVLGCIGMLCGLFFVCGFVLHFAV